jgi:N-acetylglucosamine-6-phosphate deacetylase
MKKTTAIKARRVVTPLQDLRDAVVLVEGGKIAAVGLARNVTVPEGAKVMDAGSNTVVPGFIDLHHHGAAGEDAGDGPEAINKIAAHLVTTGTTGWLPTVDSKAAVEGIVQAMRAGTGTAQVAGVHMEGPFLAPKRVRGQEVLDRGLLEPSLELFTEFLSASDGQLRIMGVAPELPGALELIGEMRRCGVTPAVAHTKASYEQFMRAVEAGARHITHTYNVMSGFHHRRPGVVGGVLTCDQVTAELIGDGFHVSPPAMDVLIRCKGVDKVALITDNVPLAGLPDGAYEMFGHKVEKKDGVSRIAGSTPDQDNTMAGSEWPMNRNLRNLVDLVGVPFTQAIRMATLTPARIVGLESRMGSIEPGSEANLVAIDEQFGVQWTMVKGEVVFQA